MHKQQKLQLENVLKAIREQTEGAKRIAGAQSIWKGIFLLNFFAEQLIASLDDDSIDPPVIVRNFLNEVGNFSNALISSDRKRMELHRCNGQRFPRFVINKEGLLVDDCGKVEHLKDKNMEIAITWIFRIFKPSFFNKAKKKERLT